MLVAVCILLILVVVSVLFRALLSRGGTKNDDVFMVVLGSGGHTAEMMQLLRSMEWEDHVVRCYVVAETDTLSEDKALAFERMLGSGVGRGCVVERVSRSREVGQRYITSVWTTLVALWSALGIVMKHTPRVLLVNGPGTCLPLVVWCRVTSLLGLIAGGCRVFYVESIARVDHVSLTGRLIYMFGLANGGFYVQWKELHEKLDKSVYAGRVY